MSIVYRLQKQEPLTIEEMDGNFANLDRRLKMLEAKEPSAEGVGKISQEGDLIIFHSTSGNILGKVVLPKVFPAFKGKWQTNTMYRVMDWVQVKQGLFSCQYPHTSQAFDTDCNHWQLVFEI